MSDVVLQAERVDRIFRDCLIGDRTGKYREVEGVMMRARFSTDKLEEHHEMIAAMLACLPDNFREGRGGGWSFLNACEDRDGRQWTSLHETVDQLVVLGIGTGAVRFSLDRELWGSMPGGMPYFTITGLPDEELNG